MAAIHADLVGRRLAHFRVVSKLGQGGMGMVFTAEDSRLGRAVALKVLPPDRVGDEEYRRRFLREARAAAAVTHAGIATIYDVGEADGHLWIAMELVRGCSLRERLAAPLPLDEVLRIGGESARALASAHRAGIIHRDLKPENVMLDEEGRVKLLDFGIARWQAAVRADDPGGGAALAETSGLTIEGQVIGTPHYMSPEQADGREVDRRTDVFALGVLLYEMLAGRRPFVGASTMAVLTAVLRDEPPPLPDHLPADLRRLVARCLAKQSDERWPECDVIAEGIALLRRGAPAPIDETAAPALAPAPEQRTGETRLPRPRRAWLALALVPALLGLAGLGWRRAIRPPAPRSRAAPPTPPGPPVGIAPKDAALAPTRNVFPCRSEPDPGPHQGLDRAALRAGGIADSSGLCRHGLVAWCDQRQQRVACCADGLMPYGLEGGCGCPPGGSTRPAALQAGCPQATQERLDDLIRRQIRRHIMEIKECYEQELEGNQRLRGKVWIRFSIAADGGVTDARVEGASLPAPGAQRCILDVFRALKFPPPPEGHVIASYPLTLRPVN